MTSLENETQVHYASERAVAEAFLPLALQQAERAGLDVEDPAGYICSDTFRECVTVRAPRDERQPSEREVLTRELERDADAFARLINSKNLPADMRHKVGEIYDELTDAAHGDADVVRARYVAAMLRQSDAVEGGA